MTTTNAAKVSWESLEITGVDDSAVTGEERIECLREFRKDAGMNGYFFTYGGGAHEDEADASTWGPESADSVDWSGFPTVDAFIVEYEDNHGTWQLPGCARNDATFDSHEAAQGAIEALRPDFSDGDDHEPRWRITMEQDGKATHSEIC